MGYVSLSCMHLYLCIVGAGLKVSRSTSRDDHVVAVFVFIATRYTKYEKGNNLRSSMFSSLVSCL
jgi:hypothetical protein